jgi:hypothetical protein
MADKKRVDIDINGNASGYRMAAQEAEKITGELSQELQMAEEAGAALGNSIVTIGKASVIALSAAAAAAGVMTNRVIDQADGMNDLRQKTGLAVEEIGAWTLATEQSGTSTEALANGLKFANKYIVEHSDNLHKMGITGKTSSEVLIQLAGIISSMPEDDPRRTALAMEVLGKSASDLLPLLSAGEEGLRKMLERGRELNPITEELARNADAYKDSLAELDMVTDRLGAEIAMDLLPTLTDVSKAMTQAAKDSGLLMSIWVGMGGLAAHALGLDDTSQAVDRLAEVNYEIKEITDRLRGGGVSTTSDGIRGLTEQETQEMLQRLKQLGLEAANLQAVINPTEAEPTKRGKINNGAIDKVLTSNGKGSSGGTSIYGTEMKDLAALILEIEKLDDVEKAHSQVLQEKLDAYSQLDPALKNYLQMQIEISRTAENLAAFDKAAAQGDENAAALLNEEMEREKKAQDERDANFFEYSERLREENEDLNVDLIESDRKRVKAQAELDHQRSIQRINNMMLEGDQAQQLLEKEEENYKLRLKEIDQQLNDSKGFAKEFGFVLKSQFEDAVRSGKGVRDTLQGIGMDFLSILQRKYVTDPLAKAATDMIDEFDFGSIFDSIKGIFSGGASANGNVFSNGSMKAFADGGAFTNSVVNQPTVFPMGLMGEAGDEAIMPLQRDSSGKLGVRASGGAGASTVVIQQTIHIDSRSDQASIMAAMRLAKDQAVDAVINSLNRGGAVARAVKGV